MADKYGEVSVYVQFWILANSQSCPSSIVDDMSIVQCPMSIHIGVCVTLIEFKPMISKI